MTNVVRLEVKGMRAEVRVKLMEEGIIGVRLLGGMVGWRSLGRLLVCPSVFHKVNTKKVC